MKRQHAVIGGTGRAGTSFLVKFLDACGLETDAEETPWFSRARAGLEHRLDLDGPLPYVVKDPWLFTYCEQLDLHKLQIDALVLPMRDLMSAAESRVHQERIASSERQLDGESSVQVIANTPGGVLYSLDVVDQSRILSVGFYNLLNWAVVNDLPIFLVSFPRMVEDPEYLLQTLWPWLGRHCTVEVARKAFEETAAADAVRIQPTRMGTVQAMVLGRGEPDPTVLHQAALHERIRELQQEHVELTDRINDLTHTISLAKEGDAAQQEARAASDCRVVEVERERDELAGTVLAQTEQLRRCQAEAGEAAAKLERAERHLMDLRGSATWRLHRRIREHRWLYRPIRRLTYRLTR